MSSTPNPSIDQAFRDYQKTGAAESLAEVFDGTAHELTRVACHLTKNVDLAEDLVQATFLVAIENRHHYAPRSSVSVMSWLMGILTNLARRRHAGAFAALPPLSIQEIPAVLAPLDREPSPQGSLQAAELSQAVTDAIGKLPDVYRPILTLHLKHGLSAHEIAMALQGAPGTVRKQLSRGLDLLRRALPSSLIAGAVVLTVPAKGIAAMREVVLAKAAAVKSTSAISSFTSLFTANKSTTLLLGTTTLLAATFSLTLFLTNPNSEVQPATSSSSHDSILNTTNASNGIAASSSTNSSEVHIPFVSSPPPSVASPSPITLNDPRRILPMTANTLASFSSPQPSAVPEPVPMCTLSTLVLSTIILFPTLLPSQSPIYSFSGQTSGQNLGISVSAADVNQDGYADLLVGGHSWDNPNAGSTFDNSGRAYVFSGKDGTALFIFSGDKRSELGNSVSRAGDVNQDGYPDMLVGAHSWDNPNTGNNFDNRGRAYVFSGKDGSLILTFTGENPGDELGFSLSAADVNQDGYADPIIGSYFWDYPSTTDSRGRVYVNSGKDGGLLLTFDGENAGDQIGSAVSGASDMNLDGTPDLLAGAHLWDAPNAIDCGRIYVFSGKDGSTILSIDGENANDRLGVVSISAADDINMDGYPDLIAGAREWDAPNTSSSDDRGRAYLFSGKDGSLLFTADGENPGDQLGQNVSSAGDVNQDGYFDLTISAFRWDSPNTSTSDNRGRVYIFSGKDGGNILSIDGENAGDFFGVSVSSGFDVNQDGIPDLLVGACYWDNPSAPADVGRAYVYSGTSLPLTTAEHQLSISQASTQNLSLSAGASHAGREYWVFGNFAVNGTSPGVTLGSVNIPLNPDPWTQVTIDFANTAALSMTKGTLDGNGQASASLNSLAPQPAAPLGLTLQHTYLVYQSGPPDAYYMASNLVPWTTVP